LNVLHVAVRGRVQGVGFRWFVRERARQLGLSGWVRNEADGSVEVFAIGPHSELAKLRRLLEQGPPAASVDAVVDENEEPSAPALTPFGVLR
jgi:acylphosphatase